MALYYRISFSHDGAIVYFYLQIPDFIILNKKAWKSLISYKAATFQRPRGKSFSLLNSNLQRFPDQNIVEHLRNIE